MTQMITQHLLVLIKVRLIDSDNNGREAKTCVVVKLALRLTMGEMRRSHAVL